MEMPCVYIFCGPQDHMDLLEQLLDVSNNPAIQGEDDADTRSKQRTSKRKKASVNRGSKLY